MYFKGKKDLTIMINVGNDKYITYPEFSKIQQWLEVGQRLEKLFSLSSELNAYLLNLNGERGPLIKETYDRGSGLTHITTKSILPFAEKEDIERFSRLIKNVYTSHLPLICRINNEASDYQSYKNLLQHKKSFSTGSEIDRDSVKRGFDFSTLDSFQRELSRFWDDVRKGLDDLTREIIIPERTDENNEFYHHFVEARDCYSEGNKEIALAIMRKALEDVLFRILIVNSSDPPNVDISKLDRLDNLPGKLQSSGFIEKPEMRDAIAFVKYGNSGAHVFGEISSNVINTNCATEMNKCMSLIDRLSKMYHRKLMELGYSYIEITKTGFSLITTT